MPHGPIEIKWTARSPKEGPAMTDAIGPLLALATLTLPAVLLQVSHRRDRDSVEALVRRADPADRRRIRSELA